MATKTTEFTLLGLINVVVENAESLLTSATKKTMDAENRSYWQLSYKPKGADKEVSFNIFDDNKLFSCAGYATKEFDDETVERLVAEAGEEARDSIIGKFKRAEQLQKRICYHITFEIPEGYKYVAVKDGKVQTRKDFVLGTEGDLSTLKETESEVVIDKFDYWVAEEPDQRDVARMLMTVGKFVKKQ